jgi:hypothetical protein
MNSHARHVLHPERGVRQRTDNRREIAMFRFTTAAVLSVLGLVVAEPAAAAYEPPVDVVVTGLAPDVARAIKRHAAEGRTVLLKYLDRGRFVYEVRTPQVTVNPIAVPKAK